MLRNILKFASKTRGFPSFKPQALRISPVIYRPSYYFCSDQPPKGFEKFNRKRRQNVEPKDEKESTPKEQKIELGEEHEYHKREKKSVFAEDDKKEKEETPLENDKQEKEHEKNKQNEKEKEKEAKQTEKEEQIENEDDKKEKKQKKADNPFDFNVNFKWEKKTEGKGQEKGDKGSDPKNNPKLETRHFVFLSIVGFLFLQSLIEYYYDRNSITYSEFAKNLLEQDKITKISIRRINDGSSIKVVAYISTTDSGEKMIVLGNVDNFLENLERYQLEKGKTPENLIPVVFDNKVDANKIMDRFINFVYMGVTVAILYFIYKQFKSGMGILNKGGSDIFGVGKSQVKIYGIENKIKTRFKDVAGLDEAKVEITEFVEFLKKPKKFKEIGAKIPRGALLTGPPGTGKTLLAKAAAGEAGVPFLYISGSDFVEMFVGVGASRVRDLFKKAKEHAPSIIFIDEIDAVGKKRESRLGGNDERDNTLNQLLVEMDGFGTESSVVVLAATNRNELLDPALTRPGRFDRSIEITLPDIDGRRQIFMVHLKPLKLDPAKSMEDYAKRLATLTPGFSGADIANLCNEAAILAARRNKKFISSEEFEAASERVLAGLEKKKVISEEERKVVAIHESGHAVVSWFTEGGHPLLKLTIIPRSKGSLGFAQYLPNESSLESREELMDRIACVLGGRCAEELFNGKITTGAYDDLRKAYDIAHAMITKFGMSEKIGYVGFQDEDYYRKYSDITAKEIDDEIKVIIDECTEKARQTVLKYRDAIEKLSNALLEKETLDLQAIIDILGERPFPPKSNYKAFLEYKKEKEIEDQEIKEKHKHDEENPENEDKDGGDKRESAQA